MAIFNSYVSLPEGIFVPRISLSIDIHSAKDLTLHLCWAMLGSKSSPWVKDPPVPGPNGPRKAGSLSNDGTLCQMFHQPMTQVVQAVDILSWFMAIPVKWFSL